MKSNLPATNPLQAKSVTCTSSSGSEGRNPSAPRLTESSPSSCAPEGGASGELVQQRRAGGQVEELDVRQEASQCGHEHHALARADDAQPPAARRPRRRRRRLATDSSALQRRTSRL